MDNCAHMKLPTFFCAGTLYVPLGCKVLLPPRLRLLLLPLQIPLHSFMDGAGDERDGALVPHRFRVCDYGLMFIGKEAKLNFFKLCQIFFHGIDLIIRRFIRHYISPYE